MADQDVNQILVLMGCWIVFVNVPCCWFYQPQQPWTDKENLHSVSNCRWARQQHRSTIRRVSIFQLRAWLSVRACVRNSQLNDFLKFVKDIGTSQMGGCIHLSCILVCWWLSMFSLSAYSLPPSLPIQFKSKGLYWHGKDTLSYIYIYSGLVNYLLWLR